MVRKIAALLFFLSAAAGLPAESDLSLELDINNIFLRTREITGDGAGDPYIGWMTSGAADLSYKSAGNTNVKADLAFSFGLPEQTFSISSYALSMPVISIDRAYVKARFPVFRITAGKTRLSWGDGFVFNSADVIFGSTGTDVDLSAAEIRTETSWLTAVNIPLGRFAFIEALAAAPDADAAAGLPAGRLENFSAGGRFYFTVEGIKIEGGYYFDNSEASPMHKPYLGLQGNLIADWYLASSVFLPAAGSQDSVSESAADSFNISFGLFYLVPLEASSSLTFRIEGLYRPFQSWQEESPQLSGATTPFPAENYALLLYPEITWQPDGNISLSFRSIFSPVDLSAMLSAGIGWNILQNFDINLYLIANAGDGDDIFAWSRTSDLWQAGTDIIDGWAAVFGFSYAY